MVLGSSFVCRKRENGEKGRYNDKLQNCFLGNMSNIHLGYPEECFGSHKRTKNWLSKCLCSQSGQYLSYKKNRYRS